MTLPFMKTLAALLLSAAAIAAAPAAASAAPAACPSTFSVLHDDQIGTLAVPAGAYQLTVSDPALLPCAHAADLFRQFLEDFDGKLPAPWRLDAATLTFSGAAGISFSIATAATPSGGGGQHPATGLRCPGVFQVMHNDHIGVFTVPAGSYTVTLLSAGPLTCDQAMSNFARFLRDYDGRLQGLWLLDWQNGTFIRGTWRVGFRVEPAVNPLPGPTPSQWRPALPGHLPGAAQRPHRRAGAPARPLLGDTHLRREPELRGHDQAARGLPAACRRSGAATVEAAGHDGHLPAAVGCGLLDQAGVVNLIGIDPFGDRLQPGSGTAFVVLAAFLIAFLAIRTSARLTRGVSWWPGGSRPAASTSTTWCGGSV